MRKPRCSMAFATASESTTAPLLDASSQFESDEEGPTKMEMNNERIKTY